MAEEWNKGLASTETAGIKSEIERTRVEMSETLGEIQERLRPDHLIQQAKDTVTGAATGKVRNIMHSAGETATRVADQTRYAGRTVAEYACAHPLQMAALAGGITWYLLRGRSRQRFDTDVDADFVYGEDRSLREKAGEYVSSARESVGEYATSVRDAASTASVRARETWNRTSTSVDDWVHEYPIAAGALAVAVGAAIGLSVPNSEFEDRTLGERRDRAMEAARAKARELKDTVTERANRVADAVADLTAPTTPPGTTSVSDVGISGTSPSTTGRV